MLARQVVVETGAPKECGMHCAIENGGFEQELRRCSVKTMRHES